MKRLSASAAAFAVLVAGGPVLGAALEEGKTYRLDVHMDGLKSPSGAGPGVRAHKGSKFVVVDAGGKAGYVVRFLTSNAPDDKAAEAVAANQPYLLPKLYETVDPAALATAVFHGPVSGPLVVPFKFRLDSDSLTGEAALGYYAGWAMSIGRQDRYRLPFVPFFSGGISQVTVEKSGASDTKSAFTWAAGIMIQNWGNANIGILYGEDRVGDAEWEHEGNGWFSFNVGWNVGG